MPSQCLAMDKVFVGRRELWARCRLPKHHERIGGPLRDPDNISFHHDPKFPHHDWEETFYEFEYERGKAKVATKKKVRACKSCGKPIRSDDACVCREIGETKSQAIMFAEERVETHRESMARDKDEDWEWLEQQWAEQHKAHLQMIAESDEPYYGEF